MSVLTVVLYTLVVVIALLLIGLILIQQSKGGGFGAAFGGVGESVFGAHAGSHMTKLTVIMTALFFILTLLLAVVVGHSGKEKSVAEINMDITADAKAQQKSVKTEVATKNEKAPDVAVKTVPAAAKDSTIPGKK
ncbi:MAG: preprotein translocase subunit SecG [Victivallaceae bacterium]